MIENFNEAKVREGLFSASFTTLLAGAFAMTTLATVPSGIVFLAVGGVGMAAVLVWTTLKEFGWFQSKSEKGEREPLIVQ